MDKKQTILESVIIEVKQSGVRLDENYINKFVDVLYDMVIAAMKNKEGNNHDDKKNS